MIIRKSNPIPVEPDGAEGIPPALGVETCSGRTTSAPAALPLGSGRNFYDSPACESLIASERGNPFRNNFTDQAGTVVLIGVARHGLGIIALPFTFHRPFHGGQYDG